VSTRIGRRAAALVAGVLLAAVVLVGCGGGSDSGGGGSAFVEPKGPSTETLSFVARNFSFTPDKVTAKPGIATIKLSAEQGIHDFVFDGAYPGFQLEADGGGGSQSMKIDLKPGAYTFYCSLPGHRAAGMEGTLTVK
jgi:plastocyanin